MKKILICLNALMCSTLYSCNNAYYSASNDAIFKDQIWSKNETIIFQPQIDKTNASYDIVLDLQHIMGYNIDGFDVNVNIMNPSGEEVLNKNYYLKMKDEQGNYISDCTGDYCELTQILENKFQFSDQGSYTITISQQTTYNDIAGFLKLRLSLL